MLELELLPDGDVDVPLARNGGRGTFLLRLGGDLVGTEALLDGLVLVFDAARAWEEGRKQRCSQWRFGKA